MEVKEILILQGYDMLELEEEFFAEEVEADRMSNISLKKKEKTQQIRIRCSTK